MHFVEDHDDIPFECYGSCQDHEAIDIALNRRLIGDIFQQQRMPGAIALVDLLDCYDRIVHSIMAIGVARWGVPTESHGTCSPLSNAWYSTCAQPTAIPKSHTARGLFLLVWMIFRMCRRWHHDPSIRSRGFVKAMVEDQQVSLA